MTLPYDKAALAIRETATEWAARLDAPQLSQTDKVAFAAWLRASPIHVSEYLRAEAVRHVVKQAVRQDTTDVGQLLAAHPTNVVDFPPEEVLAQTVSATATPQGHRRRWNRVAIAASVTLVCGALLVALASGVFTSDSYATSVGETRTLVLEDGSVVELNTDSKVSVQLSAQKREVRLTRGEAYFTVARDPNRPFSVFSDTAQVRAVGTQFNVYRESSRTVVTVVEGRVVVSSPKVDARTAPGDAGGQRPNQALDLIAGDRAVIEAARGQTNTTRISKTDDVDTERATSWRQSRLIFHDEPLTAVVAEFNRYNRQQLTIDNPELSTLGISGVFDPHKPQGLLMFLQKKSNVQVSGQGEDRIVLR